MFNSQKRAFPKIKFSEHASDVVILLYYFNKQVVKRFVYVCLF